MEKQLFNRTQTPFFSNVSNQLTYNQNELTDLLNIPFSLEAFEQQIKVKKQTFNASKRTVLQTALKEQYGSLASERTQAQLDKITDENTFFVSTGHQLNLLTGPLYFIYKIAHVIKLAQQLNEAYPEQNFIPVYWMATEDHDFEEINHFRVFGKKITWETDQKGAVGKFKLNHWETWKEELKQFFHDEDLKKSLSEILDVYKGKNLAEATRRLVHFLFNETDLIIVDGDDALLKKQFSDIMTKEIEEQFVATEVKKSNEILEEKGFQPQVHVRPLNLFYLGENSRERLILSEDGNSISIERLGSFSISEITKMIAETPELFSPNALMRPLYQECILPNLAYVGGGGELAYWLQLKSTFETAEIPYPLISIRNSFQLISKNVFSKIEKLNLTIKSFFDDIETIKKNYIFNQQEDSLDFSEITLMIQKLEQALKEKALVTDQSLVGATAAEVSKIKKIIEGLQKRLIKAEKTKHETAMKRIEQIAESLYPEGKLQERYDNFIAYYLKQEKSWIKDIIAYCEPFGKDLIFLKT